MTNDNSKAGWVYLIHAEGTNRYKIGRSKEFIKRHETLKKQSPYPLIVLKSFYTTDTIYDKAKIHKFYDKNRIYGEWFEFSNFREIYFFYSNTMYSFILDIVDQIDCIRINANEDYSLYYSNVLICIIENAREENKLYDLYNIFYELIRIVKKNLDYIPHIGSFCNGYLKAKINTF